MAKLIYVTNTSLDGYSEGPDGGIDFGAPDEEYFSLINDIERPVGTYLYGRRMYEAMIYWETAPTADQPTWIVDFTNIWRAADKIVFSKTLASVASAKTTLEREFNVEATAIARELHRRGMALRAIAAELDVRGLSTRTGQPWSHVQVRRLLQRAAA